MGKKYAYIENGVVSEIITSEGIFEDIPIEERYNKDFVEKCVEITEDIKCGMMYNSETKEFTEPVEEKPIEEDIVEEVAENGIGSGEEDRYN